MSARSEVRQRIRGLYGLADAGASGGDPLRMAAWLLEGGCRLVQLRCKGWAADEVRPVARELVERCRAVGATCIVNDWPEVAAAVDADGVHVGQTDAAAAAAREVIGPDRILGRSTNDPDQISPALRGADYVAFGPVFGTPHLSRPKRVQGLEALARARELVPPEVPLVAIGGITPERLSAVRRAGADAWAVIGAVARAPDPVEAVRALLDRPALCPMPDEGAP